MLNKFYYHNSYHYWTKNNEKSAILTLHKEEWKNFNKVCILKKCKNIYIVNKKKCKKRMISCNVLDIY